MSARSRAYDHAGEQDVLLPNIAHAAATATETLTVFKTPCRAKLKAVKWIPDTAITGANTNTTHINIINRGTDGTLTTEIANKDWTSGVNTTAFGEVSIYAPAAGSELQVSLNHIISCTFEKVGTGLDLPKGTFVFTFDPN